MSFKISTAKSFARLVTERDLIHHSPLLRYGLAILSVILATGVNLLFREKLSDHAPSVLYFIAITLCARFTGFGSSVVASVLSAIAISYFFLNPYNSIKVDAARTPLLLIFILAGVLVSAFSYAYATTNRSLRNSAQRFQNLITHSVEGIATLSPGGEVTFISSSVENICGFTSEELIKNNRFLVLDDTEKGNFEKVFLEVRKEYGKSKTITHKYGKKDGSHCWMDTTLTNMLNVEGVNAIVANFRDVSLRYEQDQKKNEFLGIAAHEIKNPLASLTVNLHLITEGIKSRNSELIKTCLVKSEAQITKMNILLNDLLNISKFESNTISIKPEPVLFENIIKESIQTFSVTYRNRVVVSGSNKSLVFADRHRIEQVLVNLLSNAAKYSSEEDEIKVEAEEAADQLKVSVIDKGAGIPLNKQKLVFKKFQRLTDDSKVKGFGLGLFISAEIIKAHEGEIGVESEEGKGSTFWFTVPKADNKAGFATPAAQTANSAST
jgi:PAS domain S-box-containing protein